MIEQAIEKVREVYPDIQYVEMDPRELVFEQRVRMKCFYCGKYNHNWRCPPKLPQYIDYEQMMHEYAQGLFVYLALPINAENYQAVRAESSITLHRALLALEKEMWEANNVTSLSFIGGSCKLCKNGCGKDACNNPYNSRSPLEATGVNVIESTAKYGISISFPPKDVMMRVGLFLW